MSDASSETSRGEEPAGARFLGVEALDETVPPDEIPEEVPGKSRVVDVGDVRLHVVEAGPEDGKLLVLLHGFPEFWYGWHETIVSLANAGYRVVVPDQRGYNLSEKPSAVSDYRIDALARDVVGLIDAYDRETAAVAGRLGRGGGGCGSRFTTPTASRSSSRSTCRIRPSSSARSGLRGTSGSRAGTCSRSSSRSSPRRSLAPGTGASPCGGFGSRAIRGRSAAKTSDATVARGTARARSRRW